jgi:hypothetical protein
MRYRLEREEICRYAKGLGILELDGKGYELKTERRIELSQQESWWVQTMIGYLCKNSTFPYRTKRKVPSKILSFGRSNRFQQMKWGRALKKAIQSYDFRPSFSNGARFWLFKINGILFLVVKRRVLHKRHRTPTDKTSGLRFDTEMYPHEFKNLHGNTTWANKMNNC